MLLLQLLGMLPGLRFEWQGCTASSTISESVRNTESQASLQTSRLRICPLTRSPGVEKPWSRTVIPKAQASEAPGENYKLPGDRPAIPHRVVLLGGEHPRWFWWIPGLKTSKSICRGHFPRLMGPHSEKSFRVDLTIIIWDCGLLWSDRHTSPR